MIHLGDITKIHGCTAPIVDCIIGGSPCQDLSVAGKRAGFSGERSVLFLDQIRVTKEMRHRDRASGRTGELIRPRYMVWENVPGAFSSNGGRDFQSVLTETVRVAEPEAPPVPIPKNGWPTSGCLMGNGWSLAWRVLDAQFWGVPQRRRRIALIADFGGATAPEILFIRKSLSGNPESGRAERETAPCGTETCLRATGFDGYNGCMTGDTSATLGVNCGMSTGRNGVVYCLQGNGIDRAESAGCNGKGWKQDISYTLNTIDRPAVCCLNDQGGSVMSVSENITGTLRAQEHGHNPCILDITHANDVVRVCGNVVPSLQARAGTGGNQVPLCYGIGNGQAREAVNMVADKAQTLNTMHDVQGIMECANQRIRRLTPLECERLQGFPDGWTDIGQWTDSKSKLHKESSDSARYKALGNSIALPPWKWVLKRLCAQYERDATMASLFDGIGGFPLIWEQINGKGSCLWASEIEEFPIAVTKYRFPDSSPEADRRKYENH